VGWPVSRNGYGCPIALYGQGEAIDDGSAPAAEILGPRRALSERRSRLSV
jgi:hypothetical protein